MSKNLTVLILAAGYGKRMGPFSRMVNKSLIPFNNKPLISHIIDKFDSNTEFIVACGYKGQQIKDYLNLVHGDKNFITVDIPDFNDKTTGPATTVRYCAEYLRKGFLLVACDTLFDFNWHDKLDHSWIGVYPVDSHLAKDYDWVSRNGNKIVSIHNKESSSKAVDAFIGLLYDHDGSFLRKLEEKSAKENIEGFENVDFHAYTVQNWLDFGTFDKWRQLNSAFKELSFHKPDEIFYNDNNKIIKFFTDVKHVNLRLQRAEANLKVAPKNIKKSGNFLVYDYVEGDIIYNQASLEIFKSFLDWCNDHLWIKAESEKSKEICYNFYYSKTIERLSQLRTKYVNWSEPEKVNNHHVETIDTYLSKMPWKLLTETVDWRFIHGDLHFDNMIYNSTTQSFTMIDWRTDFGGELFGDIYYDLAKLLGGLKLNYNQVKSNLYKFYEHGDSANIMVPSVPDVESYIEILREWVLKHGLSWEKVMLLVPLIYLNMSPLHDFPFDKFLVSLAQFEFEKIL